jgi:antitoxin component of MazEF toxin-antitoxin module
MTYAARVDQNGLLTLPQELCEHLGLVACAEVELEESNNVIRLHPRSKATEDADRIQTMMERTQKYVGSQREQFLAEGWTSVDEYIADMRGE